MVKKLLRLIMILMLVLMGSAQAMAQGLKIKKFTYAKSGETLKGEQIYARTRDDRSREDGYAPYPWILYLENGGSVDLKLPNFEQFGEFYNYGSNKGTSLSGDVLSGLKPGSYSFSYYLQDEHEKDKRKRERHIDVRVVPYAVPYLGELRLQGAVSGSDNVRLEKTVSEEDFFTYTINSDADLKTIKINPQGGYEIDGNLGIHAALIQRFPERDYEYALRLPIEQERSFASGVNVSSLKNMAVQQRLNPNDFVLQIGLDDGEVGSVFSEVYLNQARYQRKTTFLRILDKRPRATLKAEASPADAGEVLINGAHQSSVEVIQGTQVSLEAQVQHQDYVFSHWMGASQRSLGTDAKLSYVVSKDETITAVFKLKTLTIKATSSDPSLGTVSPTEHKGHPGDLVTFTATATEDGVFKGWKQKGSDLLKSADPVFGLVIERVDEEWIAIFERKPEVKYTLTAKASPEGAGRVLLDGKALATKTVKEGTQVALLAELTDTDYRFVGWVNGEGMQIATTPGLSYFVNKDETLTAVFEKKALTPQVGAVELKFSQREAIVTWATGSARLWRVKLYEGTQLLSSLELPAPQLVLVGLKPGQTYRYEIIALADGSLPSEPTVGSFTTERFDVDDLLVPYLKDFTKLQRGKSFPLLFLDVDPKDFPEGMTVEAYHEDAQEVRTALPLRQEGAIQWLLLPEGFHAKRLVFLLKSQSTTVYRLSYLLD